ncbi:hypothetical protein [Halorientalis sp. IM1011]|uniref:hypothetical protein n=1 Tax=Halorientalis sp. IM1011 TaxID=1932360 RepID=UPI0012F8A146|nr:hypothetical protein [Halorientalis sp. IM1011]
MTVAVFRASAPVSHLMIMRVPNFPFDVVGIGCLIFEHRLLRTGLLCVGYRLVTL